ncbi:MAG: ABC transporter permease [Actinomycetota bacterium]|nr:MAG: ABC transporter permease [Actinomycetota bacterium]
MRADAAAPAVRLIVDREVRERLRAKSFIVVTLLLLVAILAGGVIARLVGGNDPKPVRIGVTMQVGAGVTGTLPAVAAAEGRAIEVVTLPTTDAARQAVLHGDVDVAIAGDPLTLFVSGSDGQDARALAQDAAARARTVQSLQAAGLSSAEITTALSPPALPVSDVAETPQVAPLQVVAGTVAAILLFIMLQTFGQYVLVGVVEEKASAVVEVLLARVHPRQLLAGKVIGIGLVALGQFVLVVIAGVAALRISGVVVPDDVWAALPMAIVWFLGGYALYSVLFALAGSLVSRQEDAQSAAAPISTVLLGAYLVVFVVGYAPESTLTTVLSLIPPLTPLLMPMRMAAGAAPVWQVGLGLLLLTLAIALCWWLTAIVYEQVLLRRGARIGWRDALAGVRRGRARRATTS